RSPAVHPRPAVGPGRRSATVKPAAFDYRRPADLDSALALLRDFGDDVKVLAGGQSLVPMMNFRLARPAALIDLNRIGELAGVRRHNGTLVVGAMTRQGDVEPDPAARSPCPALPAPPTC